MTRTPLIRALLLTAALGVGAPALASPIADLMPKLAKGGPLAFKPLTLADLKNKAGKPYKATDVITAHNGKKVSAADYLKQLNQVKAQINKAGHKLRSGRPLIKGSLKINFGKGTRRAAIAKDHATPFVALRPLNERLARFNERLKAIHNPKLALDAKFKAAYPNFIKHFQRAGK